MAKRTKKTGQSPTKAAEVAPPLDYSTLVAAIGQAHQTAQGYAVQAVNSALTLRNWLIGYHIYEYDQHGSDRARYGERLLQHLTDDLRKRLRRGFGRRSLEMSRQFYLRYPIAQSLIAQFACSLPYASSTSFTPLDWQDDTYFARLFRELPWTHFLELIRIDDPLKRAFYEVETLDNRWSVRELKRQLDSLLYERVGLSRDHQGVLALAAAQVPGCPGLDPGPIQPRIRRRHELLPQLSQGRGNGSWREPTDRHPAVLGEERDARRIRPGWDEQPDLRIPLPAPCAHEGRAGILRAKDAAPPGGVGRRGP